MNKLKVILFLGIAISFFLGVYFSERSLDSVFNWIFFETSETTKLDLFTSKYGPLYNDQKRMPSREAQEQGHGGSCLKDPDERTIDNEIARLDQNPESTLAQFLQISNRYHALIPPTFADYSKCTNINCVYEAIFRGLKYSDAPTLAKKAHLWYLRTGYIIAANFYNPYEHYDYQPTDAFNKTVNEFMFLPDEIDAFWRLSHALPQTQRGLSTLKVIYRLRQKYKVTAYKDACGLAQSDLGCVTLMDDCLVTNNGYFTNQTDQPFPYSFFYVAVPHEIAHHFDYTYGITMLVGQNKKYLTDKIGQRWADAETVHFVEDVKNGVYVTSPTGKAQGYVRKYAATSPTEDFADSSAYYRFASGTLNSLAPFKWKFIKEVAMGNEVYDDSGLIQKVLDQTQLGLIKNVDQFIIKCGSTFDVDDPQFEDCLLRELGSDLDFQYMELAKNSFELCDRLGRPKFRSQVDQKVNQLLKKDKNSLIDKVKDNHKELKALIEYLQIKIDLRSFWLDVFENPHPQKALREITHNIIEKLKLPSTPKAEILDYAISLFIRETDLDKIRLQNRDQLQGLFIKPDEIKLVADEIWANCLRLSTINKVDSSLHFFDDETRYADPIFVRCVNENSQKALYTYWDHQWQKSELAKDSFYKKRKDKAYRFLENEMVSEFKLTLAEREKEYYPAEKQRFLDLVKSTAEEFKASQQGIDKLDDGKIESRFPNVRAENQGFLFFDKSDFLHFVKQKVRIEFRSDLKNELLARVKKVKQTNCLVFRFSYPIKICLHMQYKKEVDLFLEDLRKKGKIKETKVSEYQEELLAASDVIIAEAFDDRSSPQ